MTKEAEQERLGQEVTERAARPYGLILDTHREILATVHEVLMAAECATPGKYDEWPLWLLEDRDGPATGSAAALTSKVHAWRARRKRSRDVEPLLDDQTVTDIMKQLWFVSVGQEALADRVFTRREIDHELGRILLRKELGEPVRPPPRPSPDPIDPVDPLSRVDRIYTAAHVLSRMSLSPTDRFALFAAPHRLTPEQAATRADLLAAYWDLALVLLSAIVSKTASDAEPPGSIERLTLSVAEWDQYRDGIWSRYRKLGDGDIADGGDWSL